MCREVVRARMFTARKKIAKEKGAEPDEFEESVAQVSCNMIPFRSKQPGKGYETRGVSAAVGRCPARRADGAHWLHRQREVEYGSCVTDIAAET